MRTSGWVVAVVVTLAALTGPLGAAPAEGPGLDPSTPVDAVELRLRLPRDPGGRRVQAASNNGMDLDLGPLRLVVENPGRNDFEPELTPDGAPEIFRWEAPRPDSPLAVHLQPLLLPPGLLVGDLTRVVLVTSDSDLRYLKLEAVDVLVRPAPGAGFLSLLGRPQPLVRRACAAFGEEIVVRDRVWPDRPSLDEGPPGAPAPEPLTLELDLELRPPSDVGPRSALIAPLPPGTPLSCLLRPFSPLPTWKEDLAVWNSAIVLSAGPLSWYLTTERLTSQRQTAPGRLTVTWSLDVPPRFEAGLVRSLGLTRVVVQNDRPGPDRDLLTWPERVTGLRLLWRGRSLATRGGLLLDWSYSAGGPSELAWFEPVTGQEASSVR